LAYEEKSEAEKRTWRHKVRLENGYEIVWAKMSDIHKNEQENGKTSHVSCQVVKY